MHEIEPYFNWRQYYRAEDDPYSPFAGREYSEFEFTNQLYNFLIHPQWDPFGSPTLFVKILYTDYQEGFTIIELLGEWNDAINNDIMWLKREVADPLNYMGVDKFILIAENVLNFHYSDESYYEEWFEDVNDTDGWIAMINFPDHLYPEFEEGNIDQYIAMGGRFNHVNWRTKKPAAFYRKFREAVNQRLIS